MSDPDLTTATLAEAAELGGPELGAEVRADSTAAADEFAPLGPDGPEPGAPEVGLDGHRVDAGRRRQ